SAVRRSARRRRVKAMRRTSDTLWRDQRGSMSITMAGVLFLLMALCVLFIDMGSLYLTRERLQGAVDGAALKAVSDPDNAEALAAAIITSNMPTDSPTIWVERGRYPPTG